MDTFPKLAKEQMKNAREVKGYVIEKKGIGTFAPIRATELPALNANETAIPVVMTVYDDKPFDYGVFI